MLDTKKSVALTTDERNVMNYSYYITEIMRFVDAPSKRYELVRAFFLLNEDDLKQQDRSDIATMMALIKLQVEQHEE